MKNKLIHTKEIVDAINNLSTYADCDFDEILECLKGRIFSAEEIGQIDTYLKRVSLGINS